MAEEIFYPVDEVAKRLGLGRAEVYRKVVDGDLKGEKRERRLCFTESELVRFEAVVADEGQILKEALGEALAFFAKRLELHSELSAPGPEMESTSDPEMETTAQVAELGRRIFLDAISGGIPDFFLDPLHDGARLLLGPEGNRRELAHYPGPLASLLRDWLKKMVSLPEEGTVREAVGQHEIDRQQYQFRLKVVPTLLGELVHVHFFLDQSEGGLEALGYSESQVRAMQKLLSGHPGILLITGAPGPSADGHRLGLARFLATEGRLVVALDRRVQYRDERLVQLDMSSGEEAHVADMWRTALDMQPNALCVEVFDLAVEKRYLLENVGAGALVIAQISASGNLPALESLASGGSDRQVFVRALLGMVESVALRRLCPHCRTMQPASDDAVEKVNIEPGVAIGEAQGCECCGDGYLGRRLLFGVWPLDEQLVEWASTLEPRAVPPAPLGELSLQQAMRLAVLDGEVHWSEALPYLAEGVR
ncbi:MAG: type II secretory ATPase GspE/PulE/Tfp pilus assembly ATPase PilB-like protein [Candidatus Latescibacterota bacterium]